MSEKTSLLPNAPHDERFVASSSQQPGPAPAAASNPDQTTINIPKFELAPGLEFDMTRKYRYGLYAAAAGVMLFISVLMVELRNCNWSPGIDLDRLQGLHISMMVFAIVLYMLSLFSIADYLYQYKMIFLGTAITIWMFVGLMVWMVYEAATNPCVQTFNAAPIDLTPYSANKNVFSRGDGVGIVTLMLDILATVLMFSAATSFWKRC